MDSYPFGVWENTSPALGLAVDKSIAGNFEKGFDQLCQFRAVQGLKKRSTTSVLCMHKLISHQVRDELGNAQESANSI
jgi:hypothetical protein